MSALRMPARFGQEISAVHASRATPSDASCSVIENLDPQQGAAVPTRGQHGIG
jgi:hypothetical protein